MKTDKKEKMLHARPSEGKSFIHNTPETIKSSPAVMIFNIKDTPSSKSSRIIASSNPADSMANKLHFKNGSYSKQNLETIVAWKTKSLSKCNPTGTDIPGQL